MSLVSKLHLKYKSNSKNYNAILARYGLYFFGLLDSLLLPKLLESGIYSEYEYYKNAVFIFPNIMLGAYSGYMYVKYSKGYDFYDSLFKIGLLFSLVFGLITCIILGNFFLMVPLLIINFYVIVEQGLKVRKKYIQAFLFKPLLSMIILSIGLFSYYYSKININSSTLILTVFSLAFLIWLPFIYSVIPKNVFKSITKFQFRKYYYLVSKIFTGTLASLVFALVIFLERFLIDKYYPDFLAEYSFVFNLAQIIVIIMSVFSYISSVEYGEKINTMSRKSVLNDFKTSLLMFLGMYTLFIGLIFIVSSFYQEFTNLVWMTALLAISKGFFFFVGIYSPIAVYKNFNTRMLKTISFILCLNIVFAMLLIYFEYDILYLLILNALFILSYSFYILDIVLRRIEYKGTAI